MVMAGKFKRGTETIRNLDLESVSLCLRLLGLNHCKVDEANNTKNLCTHP